MCQVRRHYGFCIVFEGYIVFAVAPHTPRQMVGNVREHSFHRAEEPWKVKILLWGSAGDTSIESAQRILRA